MTDDAPSENTTLLLVAVASTWLLLVILVLRFVSMVGDGQNDPLRHALSSRMLLFGSIMTILCTVQILASILDGWVAVSGILIYNCWFSFVFALAAFCGYFSEVCFRSPTILSMGSFAPNQQPMIWLEALRLWAYGTCLPPLVFIFGLPYWSDFHILPIGLVVLGIIVSFVVIGGLTTLHSYVSTRPLRWTLVSNQQQQHASSQHDCNVAIKVECVAQMYCHDNIIRAFRGSIPPERKLVGIVGPYRGDPNTYHITNPTSEKIVLVTSAHWIELTPEDPDAFLDAITKALLNQDPEHIILPSDDGDERITRLDGGKQPMIKSDGHQCDDGTLDSSSNTF